MKRGNRIVSILLTIVMLVGLMSISVFAEDVNPFPPQRPQVGIMKIDIDKKDKLAAIRTDGTINVSGFYNDITNQAAYITDAVDIAVREKVSMSLSYDNIAVLKNNGTVEILPDNKLYPSDYVFARDDSEICDTYSWADIVSIDMGYGHLVGLKSDGTVVAIGNNKSGQCNVNGWKDISYIMANRNYTIGIKSDGTVIAAGATDKFSDLRKLKNVKKISSDLEWVLLDDHTIISVDQKTNLSEYLKKQGYDFQVDDFDIEMYYSSCLLDSNRVLHSLDVSSLLSGEKRWYADGGDRYHQEDFSVVLEENVSSFVRQSDGYYAIDYNGQIYSDRAAFTSDDWILTTNITYNGNKINSDVPPYVRDGRTLAPIRAILEALGMIVTWDEASQTATAVSGSTTINVTIGINIAIVNGVEKTLDVPAEITNGRTFVPVRFFAEALNMNVDWDEYTKTVSITK